jgi:AcrR family transcriptional regulator
MAQGSADPRKYDSRLRKAQMERTAEQIVDAAAQVIAESGVTELSMARVAARAGVALRTLYRHFGTRDELLHAIGEHFERDLKGSGPPMPQTPDEFIAAMPVLFEFFEANAEAVEAMHATQTARQLRQIARGRRTERAREVAAAMYEGFSEREARIAFAILRSTFSSATWLALRKEMCLDAEEAQAAIRWMGEMYVREMERRRRQITRAGRRN